MTTGDEGTDATVTNSGDQKNAVFDFVIPRGATGNTSMQSLAVVDAAAKGIASPSPLVFNNAALITSAAYNFIPGVADIGIQQTGVYLALFHCTAKVDCCHNTISEGALIQLYLNGVPVPGSAIRQTFSSSRVENLALSVPFQVNVLPAQLRVFVEQKGITIRDASLTLIRLSLS